MKAPHLHIHLTKDRFPAEAGRLVPHGPRRGPVFPNWFIGSARRAAVGGLALLWIWQLGTASFAQPLSNIVFTVGTTTRAGAGGDWSYVLLTSLDPHLLAGKRFAIYGKPGRPADAGAFERRGTIFQQTDPAVIGALLSQSVALGQNPTELADVLNTLLYQVPGITNQSLAQKVATAFQIASADPSTAEVLGLLGNNHPGLHLCAGRAFAEPIGSVTTYEVREVDPSNGAAGDVVGRVTITPGSPVILPAPGRPFQVMANDPADHLLIRLRWGTSSELRRLSLLSVGFNVWRMPRAVAEAAGFHVTPPSLAQLYSHADFSRANRAPVIALMDYATGTGPGAADDPADRRTYFLADDGRASGATFGDGEEFYHFVTARDILGRDGLVSPGRLTRACRRLTPAAPTDVSVANTVLPGSPNQPRLQVEWEQNVAAPDRVTHYWIYRWPNPTMVLTNEAAPLNHRIGVVSHVPGTNRNVFLDNTAGALTSPGSSNIWYTVRAVSEAACDPLLSPHAGPAWGVLRQRAGPEAATGTLLGSCGAPVVMFQQSRNHTIESDPARWHVRLTCQRRDAGIAWVTFTVVHSVTGSETIGPVYFPPEGDLAEIDYALPALDAFQPQGSVSCVVGTYHDQVSLPSVTTFTVPIPAGTQRELVFFAGQVLETALQANDPLLAAAGGLNSCRMATSAVPDASGMVAVRLNFTPGTTALIQAQADGAWSDVGLVTSDANGVFWVRYPACLVGPVPPFQGCLVNLNDTDCSRHVTTAAGQRAPVRTRFRLTPRTQEYRVYRRVDDGPMTLLAQGTAAYDPANTNKVIEALDEAMPPSAARLCYFVQLLDEHGNGSPMAFLGCRDSKPEKLPRPVLAEPRAAGTLNDPRMMLTWFCPTAGVSRFQVLVKRLDPPSPGASTGISAFNLNALAGYNRLTGYLGLRRAAATRLFRGGRSPSIQTFDEVHLTPPIGPQFGPGPQFTLTIGVLPHATYDISVRALDGPGHGEASEVWTFKWTPEFVPGSVPWPARPLPPVTDFDDPDPVPPPPNHEFHPRVAAVALTFSSANDLRDYRYPVMVRIGQLDNSTEPQSNVGTTDFVRYFAGATSVNPDPNVGVFASHTRDASRAGEPLLPIVVYRQQIPNERFPQVSGDVVQVTPMIERIPWTMNATGDVLIPDRLFAGFTETKDDGQHSYFFLYVRDLQPVLEGARYRYFVVRFNDQREVVEIIPAGEVPIPIES